MLAELTTMGAGGNPAGWYRDPNGVVRWWDGGNWTAHVQPPGRTVSPETTAATTTTPIRVPVSRPSPPPHSRSRQWATAVVLIAAGALLFGSGYLIGASNGGGELASGSVPAMPDSDAAALGEPTTGKASPSPISPIPVDLRGTIQITGNYMGGGPDDSLGWEDPQCFGRGGYDDISAGTSVTVYDATGTIVGTGALDVGSLVVRKDADYEDWFTGVCEFAFAVSVPPSDFYQVEVSHRGRSTVQLADVGSVALSIG